MNEDSIESDDFSDVTQRLASWAERQNLSEKALHGFAKCFEGKEGIIDGWAMAEIRSEFRDHTLCFHSALYSYPFVATTLHLYSPDDIYIGVYRHIVTLDGKADNDFLILDLSKSEYEQGQRKRRQKLATRADSGV